MRGFVQVALESCKPPNQPLDTITTANIAAALRAPHTNPRAFPKGLMGPTGDIDMWTETKFDVTRRETSTKRPFGEVVAAIEAGAPVVRDSLDALVTSDIKAGDLRRQIENHLGPSG